jgi:GDP-D-mannose dehydratase
LKTALITGSSGQDGSTLAELLLEKGYEVLEFGHTGLDWEKHVRVDERYFRRSEVDQLLGGASKAHAHLGWKATVSFPQLAAHMVDADCASG